MNCSNYSCKQILSFSAIAEGLALQCINCADAFYCTERCRSSDWIQSHKSQCTQVLTDQFNLPITDPSEVQFIESIGKGSFGTVSKVMFRNQIFALKELPKGRGYQEVRIQKPLDHKHIIRLHHHFEQDEHLCLLMDYAENGHLKHICNEKQVFVTFLQLCQSIEYLHKRSVIHRDIKPENILLDAENNVKLCDFGLASQHGIISNFSGTFEFMAPEIIKNLPQTTAVDVWSMGAVLYWLLEGKHLVSGSYAEKMDQIINFEAPKFTKITQPHAQNLIRSMLKQSPEQRITLKEIFKHPWMLLMSQLCSDDLDDSIMTQETQGSYNRFKAIPEIVTKTNPQNISILNKLIGFFGCTTREKE